jgi:hemolysin activation/secretion protein
LQQGGWATALNYFAAQPLLRTMARSTWVSLVYADKRIYSRLPASIVSDHAATSWTPGLNGDWQDSWGGGPARSSWNLQATLGNMNYARSPDLASDAATAVAQGNYKKLSASMNRVQKLSETWTMSLAVRTQYSDKNLDSSEKFILGGSTGVRAYPTGEGVGDEGVIVNVDLQRELAEKWTIGVLVDHGEVKLHRRPWIGWEAGNPNTRNRYGLSGAGLSLGWQPSADVSLRAIVAAPLRRNPGLDAFGRNSEGGRNGGRLWATLSWSF